MGRDGMGERMGWGWGRDGDGASLGGWDGGASVGELGASLWGVTPAPTKNPAPQSTDQGAGLVLRGA